jgi:adenine-specific DNA-methyltransferase
MNEELELMETFRASKQKELDEQRPRSERNRLGQFATPRKLAVEIAQLSKELLSDEKIDFLEPACGSGVFYSALLQVFGRDSINSADAVEIDQGFALLAKESWSNLGLNVNRMGILEYVKSNKRDIKPNLILANPPYSRHHHLTLAEKLDYRMVISKCTGLIPNGLSGLYVYFVLLGTSLLRENGIGIWLVPCEFLDVNYGRILKEFLTNEVTTIRIHRFDPNQMQFDDALVSSCVLVIKNSKPKDDHKILLTTGSLVSPENIIKIGGTKLIDTEKLSSLFQKNIVSSDYLNGVPLSNIFTIKRGIATGANNFFVMSRKMAAEKGIPEMFLKPILPSPRKLCTNIIEADENGYPRMSEQFVVFDTSLPETLLKSEFPKVWKFLTSEKAGEIRNRYLIRKRTPWYRQEQRSPAPFILTYMGRGQGNKSPFRFIWNQSNARASNVYLLLYPRPEFLEKVGNDSTAYSKIFQMLNTISADTFRSGGRVYGGGLHKLEPREVGNLMLCEKNFNIEFPNLS